MLNICTMCKRPATGSVNVMASAASSVPSVMEPRCDDHNPYRLYFLASMRCVGGKQVGNTKRAAEQTRAATPTT